MLYLYANTTVASIGYVFVEVSQTDSKDALVGFYGDFSKKFIPVGAAANTIYLPNGSIIYNLNDM